MIQPMQKNWLITTGILLLLSLQVQAQEYELSCSRWADLSSRSVRNTPSTISIDSNQITISQGPTNLYLLITKQTRKDNVFNYEVLDPNDQAATAIFSPAEMTFDYSAGPFALRYFIDDIQRPDKDRMQQPADTVANSNDSTAAVEDTKIYGTAEVQPEFPGGKEAMESFINENLKYPGAAKKSNIKGVVTVSAVVEKDGSLTGVKVKKDIGGNCGEEAVRVVKMMPTWIPGQVKNEDKRVWVDISMFFPPK